MRVGKARDKSIANNTPHPTNPAGFDLFPSFRERTPVQKKSILLTSKYRNYIVGSRKSVDRIGGNDAWFAAYSRFDDDLIATFTIRCSDYSTDLVEILASIDFPTDFTVL